MPAYTMAEASDLIEGALAAGQVASASMSTGSSSSSSTAAGSSCKMKTISEGVDEQLCVLQPASALAIRTHS